MIGQGPVLSHPSKTWDLAGSTRLYVGTVLFNQGIPEINIHKPNPTAQRAS